MTDRTETPIAIQRAMSRRNELREEIRKLDTFLEVWATLNGSEPSPILSSSCSGHTVGTADQETTETPKVRPASGIQQKDFVELVRAILAAHARPLPPEVIFDEIHKKGRHVGGTKEWDNYKTKLWRAKHNGKLIVVPGAGYWLPDTECPEIGYSPTLGLLGDVIN